MNKISLTFTANQQELKNTTKNIRLASGTVDYIDATFTLGENWSGFDAVKAIWAKKTTRIVTVLNAYGYCRVPDELLTSRGTIKVNLVGSVAEEVDGETVLSDRLTTYQTSALTVNAEVPLDGDDVSPLTPSQFEQLVYVIRGYSEDAVTAKEAAESAQVLAEQAKVSAETARDGAMEANSSAWQASVHAENERAAAERAKTDAQSAMSAATNLANQAGMYASQASTSATNASQHEAGALEAQTNAQEYASQAMASQQAIKDMTVSAHAEAGSIPTATKTESGGVVNIDFGLIKGDKGDRGDVGHPGPRGIPGENGKDGQDGVTPDFSIGAVETLAPGEQATATITGTEEDPVLNLGIPQGAKGDKGDPGEVSLETLAKVMVSDTASGTIATFSDGSDALPAKSVLVTLNPKQSGSGTPSPSNIRPISGWDEVETYDDPVYGGTVGWNQLLQTLDTFSAESGVTKTYSDGVATITSTIARNGIYVTLNYQTGHKYLFVCDLKATSSYSVILGATSAAYINKTVTGDNQWHTISGISNSTTSGNKNAYIYATATYENLQAKNYNIIDLTAVFGSTKADEIYAMEQAQAGSGVAYFKSLFPKDYYEYNAGEETTVSAVNGDPYWKVTTDLPQTVYGGTLDVVSGVLTVDRAMVVIDGTQSFLSQGNLTDTKHYSYDAPNMSNSPSTYSADVISDKMPTLADNSDTVHINHRNVGIHVWIPSDQTPAVWFADNPTTVIYPLATPTTIQCDPQTVQTLIGDNNVWGGSGVSIDYYADTKLYIEKMLGA